MKKIIIGLLAILTTIIVLAYLSMSSTDKEFDTCEILGMGDIEEIDFKKYDSVLLAASALYEGNALKNLMQGEHYRKAWSTPVKLPIIFLDELHGGMSIVEEGGGKQTHSLDIKDGEGVIYSLRSINKDTQKLIPDFARILGIENLVVDGISAQHPYAAVAVAQMADALDILHTHPRAVFLPKQKALGQYNAKYGNRPYMLEYESEGEVNWTHFDNVEELIDTEDVQEWVLEGKTIWINKSALIRARLFDLVIGDWDRHVKQWGWVMERRENGYLAHPLPADRDNAFFSLEGILPLIISNESIRPELRSFTEDIDYMQGLIKDFDRYFLLRIDDSEFLKEANYIQMHLTDEVIENAFKIWPQAIYDLDAEEIMTKIKSRRDKLSDYAMEFKKHIDEQGELTEPLNGSEELELPDELIKCFDCQVEDTISR